MVERCSPDGRMLASISGNPDYMLTVWNWRQELIMLRCKAFSQDVTRVSFSQDMPGILTTAGTGHIRYVHVRLLVYVHGDKQTCRKP